MLECLKNCKIRQMILLTMDGHCPFLLDHCLELSGVPKGDPYHIFDQKIILASKDRESFLIIRQFIKHSAPTFTLLHKWGIIIIITLPWFVWVVFKKDFTFFVIDLHQISLFPDSIWSHGQTNKLAKLRRHASWVHFASNSFGPIHFVLEHFRLCTLAFEHVGHHVHLHVGHHVSSWSPN